jgi:hypothetical protein
MATSGSLDNKNLIVAGALNLTVGAGEIWGAATHLDPLSSYFTELFDKAGLVDVFSDAVVPTWRNGRSGVDSISKRLDWVLISEDLLVGIGSYKSWVDYPNFSDHALVLLRLDRILLPKSYPFKFNARWILELEVTIIATTIWKDLTYLVESDVQQRFINKLKDLKIQLKTWSKEHIRTQEEKIKLLEESLTDLLLQEAREPSSNARENNIKILETKRDKLLREEEEK